MKMYEKVLVVIICVAGYCGASLLGAYSMTKIVSAKPKLTQAKCECATRGLK